MFQVVVCTVLVLASFATQAQSFLPEQWGARLRIGSYRAEHKLKTDGVELNDQDTFDQVKFPVMIAFPSQNSKYTFSQWFFDYEVPYESENLNTASIDKTKIYNDFLTPTERTFADGNPNWALTADFKTWAIVGGYQKGVFWPLSNDSRMLKASIGLTIGWTNYNVQLSLCSSYTVNPQKISSNKKSSGECAGKTKIENFNYSGLGLGGALGLVGYEWQTKDWLLQIVSLEIGSIAGLIDQRIEARALQPKIDISSVLVSGDVISLAYFF